MRKTVQIDTPDAASLEQRRLPRKNVLLSGVITDATGEAVSECTIRDIHAQGAAVSLIKTAAGRRPCLLAGYRQRRGLRGERGLE